MNERQPAIDVIPVDHSSARFDSQARSGEGAGNAADAGSQGPSYQQPSWGNSSGNRGGTANGAGSYSAPSPAATPQGGQGSAAGSQPSVLGSIALMLVGACLVLVGVPLLILPGPGALFLISGIVLIATGLRRMTSSTRIL